MRQLATILLLSVLFSSACIKRQSNSGPPEEIVRQFVKLSAEATGVPDKRKLQDLCSGELKRTFERMHDDAFRLIYVNTKLKIVSIKILDSEQQKDSARVHYEVTVENPQGTDPTREVNSREVDLRQTNSGWSIESIRTKGTDRIAFTRGMIF